MQARPAVRLRRARREDAPALAALMSQLGYPTTPADMDIRLAAILAQQEYETIVAEIADTVVGMVGVCHSYYYEQSGCYGQIVALVVDGAFRGRQIGSMLVTEAERWLRERGIQVVVVNSGTTRKEAHRFYEQQGYQTTGVRFVKEMLD